MTAKRLRIHGVVQGVGYRHWMVGRATRLGVAGWVRNRGDGTVEALAYGPADAVEELLRACRMGPAGASVTLIEESFAEPEDGIAFVAAATLA